MKFLPPLILFTLLNIYSCQNIDDQFKTINKQALKFNAIATELTWESAVNPGNPEIDRRSAYSLKEWIQWKHDTCDKLAALSNRQILNATQQRQSYLLCRGPRFTYEEIGPEISSLQFELQSLYSDAEICIPSAKQVSMKSVEEVETAILNYLSCIKNNSGIDGNFSASKLVLDEIDHKDTFCLDGEGDFDKLMRFSRNEEVRRWLWVIWREEVSAPMREPYKLLVTIENRAARRNGYSDFGATWRDELEIPELRELCRSLYSDIRPLYRLLHGVVRFYLRKNYGDIVPERGPIPAHLLGNLWSDNWESLSDLIIPNTLDLDKNINNLNKSVIYLVKRAEDFYQSLGLPPMTDIFWRESIFTRKNDTLCHGTAADMFRDGDFRLLYCSEKSAEDFYVLHHEMGHIQYFMAYENQPAIFRQGNSALHETIGDTIMYGVMTPQHLHRLGLLNDSFLYTNIPKNYEENLITVQNDINNPKVQEFKRLDNNDVTKKANQAPTKYDKRSRNEASTNEDLKINNFNENTKEKTNHNQADDPIDVTTDEILLLKMALNKIPQIPFSLLIDEYRWKYYEGSLDEMGINKEFWDMALELQGIVPPKKMGEKFFDIGAKFHVPDNTPYIRYFLSSFLQHQLFEVLCKASVFGSRGVKEHLPETITMNRCDIYGSKTVGKVLRDLMSRGNSQSWREILQETTGIKNISASALKRYYRPLYNLLARIVRVNRIPIGW